MKYLKPFLIAGLLIAGNMTSAQEADDIKDCFEIIANSEDEDLRLSYNDSLTSALVSYLESIDNITGTEIPGIKYLGQIVSSDSLVKIFSWNIPLDSGDNLYNSIIYNRSNDNITLLKGKKGLPDLEPDISLNADKWYGALYYDIEPLKYDKRMAYILLGFDPDNVYMNSKVIDILSFNEKGDPVFGMKIFSDDKSLSDRMIFRYSPLATMMLKFDRERSLIIFDHLSPSSPANEGQYKYYGPDFSYDALKIQDGKLVLVRDIDLRNPDTRE